MRSGSARTITVLIVVALAVLAGCDGPGPASQPPSVPGPGTQSEPTVRDTGAGLEVTNNSGEALMIRAAFIIPIGGGNVGVCNPYGPPGNTSVPLPEAPSSPYDQPLGPFQSMTVPASSCPNYTGYSVWARNANGELVFEQHR